MISMIPEPFLEARRVYRLRSRNLITGVWNPDTRGFIGIREKFKDRYLFTEYHWEADPHVGTAYPIRPLGYVFEGSLDERSQELFGFLDWCDLVVGEEIQAERRIEKLCDDSERYRPQTFAEHQAELQRAATAQWRREQLAAGRPWREVTDEWMRRLRETT